MRFYVQNSLPPHGVFQENARRASHGRREQGGAPGEAYQAASIITLNGTRKRPKWGNFEAFLPAVQSGKTCIRRAKASPWGMSKSTRQLVIVGNAFERERWAAQAAPKRVMWTRDELADLLNVYGRMVAAGMWRDYAINDGREAAGFSIFRRASEVPLFRIDKIPALKRKQGQYVLHAMDGRVLRRGHDLAALMRFFDRKGFASHRLSTLLIARLIARFFKKAK